LRARAGVQDHDGYTKLSEDAFLKYLANGVEHEKADVLYAEQRPTAAVLCGVRPTVAVRHSKPTFLAVSRTIRRYRLNWKGFQSTRMKPHRRELDASHLSLVSSSKQNALLTLARCWSSRRLDLLPSTTRIILSYE